MKNIKRFDNPMDLQLFADRGPAIDDPELEQRFMEMMAAEQGGEEAMDEPVEGQEPIEEQAEQPMEGQPMEGQPEVGLEPKFGSIEEQAKGYRELEAVMTRTRTELAQQRELNNQLQSQLESQQGQLSTQEPVDGEEPEEEVDFMELFYSDPEAALRQVIEKTVGPEIAPIKNRFEMADKQEQWAAQINQFAEEHPDLANYQETMAEIMSQDPGLKNHPNGLQYAYDMAKGQGPQNVNPDELMQDEDFLNKNVMGNEEIKKRIIEEYLQSVQDGAPPASIGMKPTGAVPLTPSNKPKSFDEATEMARSLFRK